MTAKQFDKATETDVMSMGQLVEALREIANAITENTNRQSAQAGAFDTDGFRTPSVVQARASLDYRLLSQLMGREVDGVSVAATRFLDEGLDRITFFNVPDEVVKVSVLAAGSTAPEVLLFDNDGSGHDKNVTLALSADRDILRSELIDGAGLPIRVGPAMPRVPTAVQF